VSDVWRLETGDERAASDALNCVIDLALVNHSTSARNYLKALWGEPWNSIKTKLLTEGPIWYVWYMDGVRQHIANNQTLHEA